MRLYLNIAQIIVSVALTGIILLQARGGSMGSMFGGGDSAVYHKRRGVERTIFNVTIGLAVAFFIVTILNVMIAG